MTIEIKLPKIPEVELIIKVIVEEEIKKKVTDWAERQALAAAKSIGGPAALVDNVNIEMEMVVSQTELPTLTVGSRLESFSYSVPQVAMGSKVIAKLHVPEVYMARDRLPFNHHHCKVVWKTKHLGLGIKTKVPEVKCWDTPAYADVPKTRMVLREMKADVPEISMRLEEVKVAVPTFATGTTLVSMNVPQVNKVTFDVDGVAKEFIPGGSIVSEILAIIQEIEQFKRSIEEKVGSAIDSMINPVYESLWDMCEKIIEAIDQVQDRFAAIVRELEDAAGEHSEEIKRQTEQEKEEIEKLMKQLKPIQGAIEQIEQAKIKALTLIRNLKPF